MISGFGGFVDTSLYRSAFNQLSKEFGFRWVTDGENPGVIDPVEIEMNPLFASRYGLSMEGWTPKFLTPAFLKTVDRIAASLQAKRKEAVREVLSLRAEAKFAFDLTTLSEPSRQAVQHFQRIADLTDELQLLFEDPQLLDYKLQAESQAAAGDTESLELFWRSRKSGCRPFSEEPVCHSIATLPPKRSFDPNTLAWPHGFSAEMFAKLESSDLPNKEALLSHFTVVEGEEGNYSAIPYNQHALLRPRLLMIADAFDAIASIPGIDESIRKTATAYSQAIRHGVTDEANRFNPFAEAEDVWSRNFGGDLAFQWGPLEEGGPFGMKRGFQFFLFAPRKKEMDKMTKYQVAIQDLESEAAEKIPGYRARSMKADSIIHISDVILRAGLLRIATGEVLAEVLPNDGPIMEEGRPRREIFANIHDAKARFIMEPLARLSLHPDQYPLYDPEVWKLNGGLHEMAHPTGPQGFSKVTMDGKTMTAKTAMGENIYAGIEESRANNGGIYLYSFLRKRGLVTKEEAEKGYVTYVVSLLRQVRLGKESSHGRGAAAELGYHFAQGAVQIRNHLGKPVLWINLDKIEKTVGDVYIEIGRAQFEGSPDKGKAFQANQDHIPQELGSEGAIILRFKKAESPIPIDVVLDVRFRNP